MPPTKIAFKELLKFVVILWWQNLIVILSR
ncbi:MAG: hypothetical protein ACD_3C00136G0001 [uncultured bacterium (gcode 4)]|uniref:Uncharacterized protein n=1 Tax=uncultured bacterium (gcode 4) TaxID=1234023 RepID=K2GWY5_9BACT|nr:MAG: hypothetical protein ACD_3C00136G0001 [uncultured bacterium (gcode 4)]